MNCGYCVPIVLGLVALGFGAKIGWDVLIEWIEERRLGSDKANYQGRGR